MGKFEELLAKYGKTVDEVTFEYENLSDEELEVAFKEAFEDIEATEEPTVEEPTTEEPTTDGVVEDKVVVEDVVTDVVEDVVDAPVVTEENFVVKYELSHDDIRSALYSLLAAVSEDDYCYTWIAEVYDDKFIYQNCAEGKFYRQGYSKDGENISLSDEKVEVFSEWLSKDEKDALEALKADYSALETQYNELKAFKDNYDAAELKAQKDEILTREEYSVLADDEAFKTLVTDAEKYSVEEIESKSKAIFADHVIKMGTFSVKSTDEKKSKTLGFDFSEKTAKKKSAYGNLFTK